jgi:cyanophycinase
MPLYFTQKASTFDLPARFLWLRYNLLHSTRRSFRRKMPSPPFYLNLLLGFLLIISAPLNAQRTSKQAGALVIVGGGSTPEAAVKKVIALAGGAESPLVVLAQTREDSEKAGQQSAEMFRQWGAKNVVSVGSLDPLEVRRALEAARGVWIPGGDQNRFADRFPESSGVPEAIRGVFRRGGVIGGTSAGASLMAAQMPTGAIGGTEGVRTGACPVRPGLNLLPRTIIDQHFFKRNRLNRLLTALLEHPSYRGIGVDEEAWCVWQDNRLIVEAGQVMLLLPGSAPRRQDSLLGTPNMTLKILLRGDKASL